MNLDFLTEKLDKRKNQGNFRSVQVNPEWRDFVSNDYLGLARNQELRQQIKQTYELTQVGNGGTGSRLLSGNYVQYAQLEAQLQQVFRADAVLVFNSGYSANQALVSSVAAKGDTILYDMLAHVCLKEGAWLSKAETVPFRHNDLEDLESRLKRTSGRCFVLTESVFSMDGDIAPLGELVEVCERYGAYLIVDEAHSTGVYGANGAGMLVENGLSDRVFARVYTFGKGMGVHGACVAGSQLLIDFLINFGRPFIYTTSLPPHSVISIAQSFRYLEDHMELQQELSNRIVLFKAGWSDHLSTTAIQPVMIGNNERARNISIRLQERGYDVRPILSPTVQRGTERLRISLHTHNSEVEIAGLCRELSKLV